MHVSKMPGYMASSPYQSAMALSIMYCSAAYTSAAVESTSSVKRPASAHLPAGERRYWTGDHSATPRSLCGWFRCQVRPSPPPPARCLAPEFSLTCDNHHCASSASASGAGASLQVTIHSALGSIQLGPARRTDGGASAAAGRQQHP